MKIVFFYSFLLLFWACSSQDPTKTDVIATVGNEKITVQDFKIAYELFPAAKNNSGKSIKQKKIEQLDAMVANKIFANVALEKKVQNEQRVAILLQWYKDRAVIQQLYRDKVRDKVKISESEIRTGFERSNERLMLRKIDFQTKENAQQAYNRIKNGMKFEEIAKQYTRSDELLEYILTPREFSWGDLDERLEDAAYQLQQNEVSKPVESENGFHLIQLKNKKVQLIVTEEAFQNRSHYIESIIRRRREARLTKAYANEIMENLSPKLKTDTINKMINAGQKAFLEIDKESIPVYMQPELIRPFISDIMNETVIELKEDSWTIADLFQKIEKLHPNARFDLLDFPKLPLKLSLMIRDEALAREGYMQNLDKHKNVIADLSRKREETLSLYMRRALQDTIKVTEEESLDYYRLHKSKYGEPEKVKIREVMVRDKSLADSLRTLVINGADLTTIAKKYSQRKWAAEKGGDMGYFAKGAFGDVGEAAFNTEINRFSTVVPILIDGIAVGFSFFKVLDKKAAIEPEYSAILDQVSKDALSIKREKVLSAFYEENKTRFAVSANYDLLEKVKTIDALSPEKAMSFTLKEQF